MPFLQAQAEDTEPSLPAVYLKLDSAMLYLGQARTDVVCGLGGPGTITKTERALGPYHTERFDDGTQIGYYSFNDRVAYLESTNPNVSTILDVQIGEPAEDVIERFPSLQQIGQGLFYSVNLIPIQPEDPHAIDLVLIIEDGEIVGMALSYPIN